jgi:hypothetical protein
MTSSAHIFTGWRVSRNQPMAPNVLIFSTASLNSSQSRSHVTIDSQSVSVSWCQALIWGPRPNSYYTDSWGIDDVGRPEDGSVVYNCCRPSPAVILESESCGTHGHILLSRLPPTWRARSPYLHPPATGWPSYAPRQWVPFSSPPTTRRAMVEVFEPVSTRETAQSQVQRQSHITTDGQSGSRSVSLGVEPHLGLMTRYLLLFDSHGLVFVGRPL